MITLQQAIEIATKAHKGQFRRPVEITQADVDKLTIKHHYEHNCITSDGSNFYEQEGRYFLCKPYITHPLAVMAMMDTDEEKIVAVLHDVIEDCKGYELGLLQVNQPFEIVTPQGMLEVGKRMYEALDSLTKRHGCDYFNYLRNILDDSIGYNQDGLSTKVKIADMFHNISDNPSPKQKEKYFKGLKVLLAAL